MAIISFLAISYVNCGLLSGGLSGSYGAPLGYSSVPIGPVLAAVHSKRTYELRPVQSNYDSPIPQVIEVDSVEQPVHVIYKSMSSPVFAQQIHTPGAPGQIESTNSEEEAHKLVHEVYKPVIQEVREVIQPHRRVVQKIAPVLEEVHTVVAKGVGKSGYGYLGGKYGGGLALGAGYGGGYGLGLAKGGFAGLAYWI